MALPCSSNGGLSVPFRRSRSGKLVKKWKYPRGALQRGGEERERGSKLYSTHDVRNDRSIMAMWASPHLEMERREKRGETGGGRGGGSKEERPSRNPVVQTRNVSNVTFVVLMTV